MNFPKKQEFQLQHSVAAYNLIPEDYELYIGVPGTYSKENARIEFYRKQIYLSSSDLARVVKLPIFGKFPK